MKSQNFYRLLLCFIISSIFTTCKKEDNISLPIIKTYSPLYIASTLATVGCIVESDGGSDIICGLYMGTSQNPESTGTQLQIGSDTGVFLGQVTGLLPNTQYYIKAYAKNVKGEGLGDQVDFITPGTILDYDNNVYETVKISSQLWMAKNLRTTYYLNGDLIGTTNPSTLEITSENSPKYQWSYSGDEANTLSYGKLYTWYTITDTRKICPLGWHIPTDMEWTTLETLLGGYAIAGSKLKEVGTVHWLSPYNIDATNESCFSGLPGGYRSWNGPFLLIHNDGYYWSSSESEEVTSWIRILDTGSPSVGRTGLIKSFGASVRCIKDN
jgi:uncharacterized protein (TIGR02145 family)